LFCLQEELDITPSLTIVEMVELPGLTILTLVSSLLKVTDNSRGRGHRVCFASATQSGEKKSGKREAVKMRVRLELSKKREACKTEKYFLIS